MQALCHQEEYSVFTQGLFEDGEPVNVKVVGNSMDQSTLCNTTEAILSSTEFLSLLHASIKLVAQS